ncbi:hypothetical protein K502DRAFT_364536 [Neoconidiobolus thromboides FSU 785]|nr:hypothetical protein K502DRAFT_364536 [Neoconidiobolus thromboides FSU 785]
MKFLWTIIAIALVVSAESSKRECADHSIDCCGLKCTDQSASEKCCDKVEGIMAPQWCLGLKRNGWETNQDCS